MERYEEERMAQPTGPNYRFSHYAKGDKSERLLSGYSQSLETKRPLPSA
jgi:hypothetical protein